MKIIREGKVTLSSDGDGAITAWHDIEDYVSASAIDDSLRCPPKGEITAAAKDGVTIEIPDSYDTQQLVPHSIISVDEGDEGMTEIPEDDRSRYLIDFLFTPNMIGAFHTAEIYWRAVYSVDPSDRYELPSGDFSGSSTGVTTDNSEVEYRAGDELDPAYGGTVFTFYIDVDNSWIMTDEYGERRPLSEFVGYAYSYSYYYKLYPSEEKYYKYSYVHSGTSVPYNARELGELGSGYQRVFDISWQDVEDDPSLIYAVSYRAEDRCLVPSTHSEYSINIVTQ